MIKERETTENPNEERERERRERRERKENGIAKNTATISDDDDDKLRSRAIYFLKYP